MDKERKRALFFHFISYFCFVGGGSCSNRYGSIFFFVLSFLSHFIYLEEVLFFKQTGAVRSRISFTMGKCDSGNDGCNAKRSEKREKKMR